MEIEEEEDKRPKMRCFGCGARIVRGYKGTGLCSECYKAGERKTEKLKLRMRCFSCGDRTTGYKGTWLCKYCYKGQEIDGR